jgi:crossover junction endodeoxyribonuclease RusA
VTFTFARPAAHFGTGRNAHLLKPSAPARPVPKGKDDGDKLQRAVMDALTDAGMWADDSQVVEWHGSKLYAVSPWRGDGTATLERLPDPTVLCGVHDADVLALPGAVIRVWEIR